ATVAEWWVLSWPRMRALLPAPQVGFGTRSAAIPFAQRRGDDMSEGQVFSATPSADAVIATRARSAERFNHDAATLARLAALSDEAFKCQAAGQLADAVAMYDTILSASPNHAELHSNRGAALAGLGRLGEAEEAYRSAIELRPDFGDAHNNLG